MPVKLNSYKIDSDGEIRVLHTFFADTDEEADKLMEQHAGGCKAFGPALESGDTIEIYEDIDEPDLPDAETLQAVADEQEGDDEEEPEEDDEEEEDEEDQ